MSSIPFMPPAKEGYRLLALRQAMSDALQKVSIRSRASEMVFFVIEVDNGRFPASIFVIWELSASAPDKLPVQ